MNPAPSPPLIVTVGSINADLFAQVPRLPRPGETLPAANPSLQPGGKGANQAAAVARLGLRSCILGQIGADPLGIPLEQALREAGVDTSCIRRVPTPTGQAWILLQPGGENSIVLIGGANQAWTAPPTLPDNAAAVLLQREIPDAINLAAARAASQRRIPVVLDGGGSDLPMPGDLLECLTVISPNETELERLSGTRDIDVAARQWHSLGVRQVLVKQGAGGCTLLESGNPPLHYPAFQVPVIDTTGAGDCFTAAYTVALVEGLSPRSRLAFATAAAALSVTRPGAMPSLPFRREVEAFLATSGRTADIPTTG